MITINTGHGPLVRFNDTESKELEAALNILEEARQIESRNGKLHISNFIDLELAVIALKTFLINRGEIPSD